jgi:ribonuclease J
VQDNRQYGSAKYIYRGNTEDAILKDRKNLSRSGIVFVAIPVYKGKLEIAGVPEFVFKGVTFMDNYDRILEEAREVVSDTIKKCFDGNILNNQLIESQVNELIEKLILKKGMIRPIIISKVVEMGNN